MASSTLALLFLIIGYLGFRVIRLFNSATKLWRELKYKRITVDGYMFVIKQLQPIDFSEEKHGLPLTFFQYRKSMTLWDSIRGSSKKEPTEKDIQQRLEFTKKIIKAGCIFPIMDIEDMFSSQKMYNTAWKLYGLILAHSFKYITKMYEMEQNYVIHLGQVCNKLNKKPSDHIASGLSPIEAYMIDEFVGNAMIEHENDMAQREVRAKK